MKTSKSNQVPSRINIVYYECMKISILVNRLNPQRLMDPWLQGELEQNRVRLTASFVSQSGLIRY